MQSPHAPLHYSSSRQQPALRAQSSLCPMLRHRYCTQALQSPLTVHTPLPHPPSCCLLPTYKSCGHLPCSWTGLCQHHPEHPLCSPSLVLHPEASPQAVALWPLWALGQHIRGLMQVKHMLKHLMKLNHFSNPQQGCPVAIFLPTSSKHKGSGKASQVADLRAFLGKACMEKRHHCLPSALCALGGAEHSLAKPLLSYQPKAPMLRAKPGSSYSSASMSADAQGGRELSLLSLTGLGSVGLIGIKTVNA